MLNHAGAVARTYAFAPGAVRWIGLAPAGLVVQLPGAKVEIHRGAATRTVQLKPNAIVLDYAEGRILYRVGQTFWLRHVGVGHGHQLLRGRAQHPIVATLDTHGLAWTQGNARQLGLRRLHLVQMIHPRFTGRSLTDHRIETTVSIGSRAWTRLVSPRSRSSPVSRTEEPGRLAAVASELDIADGAAVTTEGEFGHALFAIETGTADVLTDGQVVGTVGPGDVSARSP